MNVKPSRVFTKAQLTRTECERLFCSLSDARIGVSCRRRRLQVAVGFTPKWTATCSRLGRQDSGRFLSRLRMEFEETLFWQSSCSWADATATLRFRPGWYRHQPTANADTDCIFPFVWVAYCKSVENLWDIFTNRNVTAILLSRCRCVAVQMSWPLGPPLDPMRSQRDIHVHPHTESMRFVRHQSNRTILSQSVTCCLMGTNVLFS